MIANTTPRTFESKDSPSNSPARGSEPGIKLPRIIQGGMGAGVSSWRLARSVSIRGELGVVSGTALDLILVRRLQDGDPGAHMRRALSAFPDPLIAGRVLERFFIEGGKEPRAAYAIKPKIGDRPDTELENLLMVANFAEVHLAKEGHDGSVGINYLNKIQAPLLPSLFGAILAGVDIVLVGAGIPVEIPDILDGLCAGEYCEMPLQVKSAGSTARHRLTFHPPASLTADRLPLKRPAFFPIVSSSTLASMLVRKCPDRIQGFVVEKPTAGGHNAPPRGALKLDANGAVYGPRDEIDPAAFRALGLPFWLAGSYGSPERLAEALAAGASGIQVGTLFAFCEESGLRDDLKTRLFEQCTMGTARVIQDPLASPTGFPFQTLSLPDTLSEADLFDRRSRQCDLGYLREAYERPDGTLGWRCAAEDPAAYVGKGGDIRDTIGRKCLCNGLMANIGQPQIRNGREELPLVTCGSDLSGITRMIGSEATSYSADSALDFLLGKSGIDPCSNQ